MGNWDTGHDLAAARTLAHALGLHPLVARVLTARGVTDPTSARTFLSPRLADLTRPDEMADRDIAAERIVRALSHRERIAIFGDYDVDGITSAALLSSVLKSLGGEVVPLVASRFDGGYGLSNSAALRVIETSATLLITCDCGTSDHERLSLLRSRGIETIVVDHHKVPGEPLPALAFLNPHRSECGFPYKGLASVGLALSIAAAVRARMAASLDLRAQLDLVAVGTIADVAPLSGDNRILTRAGLERIAQGFARPGLRALAREARLRPRLRAHDVGFSIAPMLNAPGRLGPATPTLELLLAESEPEATRLARELCNANEARRKISWDLIEEAARQVQEVYGAEPAAGIVVGGEGWHPGVGGIVAGRLAERFRRPVVVVAFDGSEGVGSARAPKGFPLFQAVAASASELEQFGGHDGAAGMRVRHERFEALRACFAEACAACTPGSEREEHQGNGSWMPVDTELFEQDIAPLLARQLDALEPTGQAHPEPLVVLHGARVSDLRVVGMNHLQAKISIGSKMIRSFIRDGVARRERGELPLRERTAMDLLGHLRTDAFVGPDVVQLELVSVRSAS